MGLSPALVALTLAAAFPSFRDAPLESRCEALKAFVSGLHAQDKTFKAGGCAEGNGLGGAIYTFDFELGEKGADHRVTVTFDGDGPVKTSVNPPLAPFEEALAQWAGARPKALTIYGKSYDEFVKGVLAYDGYFPALKDDRPTTIKFKLLPESNPRRGKVRFDDMVDPDFLKCFQCADAKCLNEQVRYEFHDRFFALTRQTSESYGAGWIVQGLLPVGQPGTAWKFVCGVSRYSLENVTL